MSLPPPSSPPGFPMLSGAERTRRLAFIRASRPASLFHRAADLIELDPVLSTGQYVQTYDQRSERKRTVRAVFDEIQSGRVQPIELGVLADNTMACHCLEGALMEAAGIYIPHSEIPGLLWLDSVLENAYRKGWSSQLNWRLLHVFDREKLAQVYPPALADLSLQEIFGSLEDPFNDHDHAVYNYSDFILAPMGRDGVLEAARLLRAAANLPANL